MKILIWGTEKRCEEFVRGGGIKQKDIMGFISLEFQTAHFLNKAVYSLKTIPADYDFLFVLDIKSEKALDILVKNEICLDKVCFFELPRVDAVDRTENFNKCASFLPDEILINVVGYEESKKYNFIENDLKKYNALNPRQTMLYDEKYKKFVYSDKYSQAGEVKNYFWQDLWAAKLIYKNNPKVHYDIGSRIDGFIAHLLTFRENIVLIDVRPLEEKIPGVSFICADATNLEGIEDNTIESLSALCSLEHFGLGRYGDTIDPEGCFKAFAAIERKIASGGMLYISVPVGMEHVEFNAHRIFRADTIVKAFSKMELVRFDVANSNKLECNVDLHAFDNRNESGCRVFGLFQFMKI